MQSHEVTRETFANFRLSLSIWIKRRPTPMLLWLIEAAGVDEGLVSQAKRDFAQGTSMMQQSAIIRHIVPWDVVGIVLLDYL